MGDIDHSRMRTLAQAIKDGRVTVSSNTGQTVVRAQAHLGDQLLDLVEADLIDEEEGAAEPGEERTYTVFYRGVTTAEITVQARSEDEAKAKAGELVGYDTTLWANPDWEIERIEVEGEAPQ